MRLQNPRTRSVQKVEDEARAAALVAQGYVLLDGPRAPRAARDAKKAPGGQTETDRTVAALNGVRDDAEPEPPSPPPKNGKGSGTDAWVAYAAAHGVEVGEDAKRDDVISALDAAGVPSE